MTLIDWETLLEQPFITLQRPSAVRVMLEEHLQARQMKLPVAFESHQLATVGAWSPAAWASAPFLHCAPADARGGCMRCITLHEPVSSGRLGC
jgi:LysR family transcriptional regulator, carnitine catabolism transcriptional activator